MAISPEKRKNNVRLGLTLASVAIAFLLGFIAKFTVFGG
jgi:hypothetical protein